MPFFLQDYIACAEIWMEYVVKHFGVRYSLLLLTFSFWFKIISDINQYVLSSIRIFWTMFPYVFRLDII